ncbi:MAG: hypothetical protein AAF557_12710 [Pseudomonadota bacterium]
MARKPSFDPDSVREANWKSFEAWLSKNSKKIAAETNLGVVYAGLRGAGKSTPSGIFVDGDMTPDLMPMWKWIKGWNEMAKAVTGKLRYQTVEDVLRGIKDYPRLKVPEGRGAGAALLYRTMYDCANEISNTKLALLPKAKAKKVWSMISKIYAANLKGDLAIMDGVMKDFKRLDQTKILIREELPKLLKNEELSDKSKAAVKKLASDYKVLLESSKKLKDEFKAVGKKIVASK